MGGGRTYSSLRAETAATTEAATVVDVPTLHLQVETAVTPLREAAAGAAEVIAPAEATAVAEGIKLTTTGAAAGTSTQLATAPALLLGSFQGNL